MKTQLRRALAMIALIAFVVTLLPPSALAEARTSFVRSQIDSRPTKPDSEATHEIEIVPHKTENPKRSEIWDGSIATGFAGGSGTEEDPYLISDGSELAYLAQQVNRGNEYSGVHFKLTNDIYLNDTTDWELWGTTGNSSANEADMRNSENEPNDSQTVLPENTAILDDGLNILDSTIAFGNKGGRPPKAYNSTVVRANINAASPLYLISSNITVEMGTAPEQNRDPDPTTAMIVFTVEDVWGDGSGYQMLLDADATAYGSVFAETGPLTTGGDAPTGLYDEFEYKIPINADGNLNTTNIVCDNTVTFEIPAGIYDWCITNPTPGDRIWIASEQGNIGGRANDFTFEAGKTYSFHVHNLNSHDATDLTVTNGFITPEPPTDTPTPITPSPVVDCWGFEEDPATQGWTMVDKDGDGYNWRWAYNMNQTAYEGAGVIYSQSYINNYGAITPDNWLITPEFVAGNAISFYMKGQDSDYAAESIGVYVSTDGGTNWSEELAYFVGTGSYVQHRVDLSDYAGTDIKVAFRHYDVTDMFSVNIDNVDIEDGSMIPVPETPVPNTPVPPADSDALSDALNAVGQSNTFVTTGSYPWRVDSTTYAGRTAAKSGNYNVSSSTSSFSTTVTLSAGDIVSFEYCVSSEKNCDKFKFSVNDSVVLTESGLVPWNSYFYQATTDGEYTLSWSYTKDSSVNSNSDACWVDNVYIGALLSATGIDVLEYLDVPMNGTGTVTYSVLPENAFNKNVSFESADESIATVDANGIVTGVSVGETAITVTTEDGGFIGACTINVYNQAVTGVTIEPSEAEIIVGSSTQLTATVLPENASNKNVIYSVDDESILSVDQNGNVTGVSLGTANVTVTTEDGGFTAFAEITVIPAPVTGVSISPKSATIGLGSTIQLTASILPSNATNKNLCWSVSDKTIISVDGQGNVTGLSVGTATVTVTTEDGGFSDSAEITVCYAPANDWTAIGETEFYYFYGYFDGDGYAVRGIYINTQKNYQGLFGHGSVIIANLGVAESYICGGRYVGGVVGYNSGTVTNCYNTGNVTGNSSVGGVVGYNGGDVTNCYNTGYVTGDNHVGGVVGYGSHARYSAVTDCYNTGSVTGNSRVGGVVGDNTVTTPLLGKSSVTDCYNTGDVTGKNYVGGVVGINYSFFGGSEKNTVTNCYNIGSVTGNEEVGGVVGHNGEDYNGGLGVVTNCYNIGPVTGNSRVGGVVGYNDYYSTVIKCYNTGSVTGNSRVGGVVGHDKHYGIITNCYYYIGCGASSTPYGTALTNEQMLHAESFLGFDFDTVWTMDGNPCYPYPKLIDNFQTSVPYMVIHNIGIKGGTYTTGKIEVFFGEPGTTVSALPIEFPGYIFDETVEGTCMSGVVAEDGSLELSLFYNGDGFEQLPEIDINKKCVYVVETGTLNPIKDAKVTVRTAEGYEIEAISNFLGMAEISVPDSSSYSIIISCDGYCPKSLENVTLQNGEVYEAALSKLDYNAPLGGSVEVTYTDANTTTPLDLLAVTKRLNSEEADFEFTITANSFSNLIDGQYELLQDGGVIKTSTDGVFSLKVSDLKPDIPLWIRIRNNGEYCKPVKLGLSTYTGIFGLHDGDEFKLMDKLTLTIPSNVPFINSTEISLDLGYIPVKVAVEDDIVKIGLGTDNLFDPEDKDMWEKLEEAVLYGNASMICTSAFGYADLGGDVKPELKVIGFAKGKISKDAGLEIVSGEIFIQGGVKYEHEWQTFALGFPIVIKVGVGLELENTLEIDWEDGLKVDDRFELTIPSFKPKVGFGVVYVADISAYGKAENILGFDTETNYYFGELRGEAGISAKVLFWESKWCILKGQWRYTDGYLKGGHATDTHNYSYEPSLDEMSYSLISRDYLKEQSGWLGDKPAKDAVGAKQTSVLQEGVLSIASPRLANINGKLISVWIADDGSRTTGNHSQLVFSVYNEADNIWSAPAAVWDDGTADFTPQMVSDGTNAYVVWVDANTVFDENVTADQMAEACEISYAKLSIDESGNVTVSQQRRLTENSSLDFQPSVAVDTNGTHIAWVRNAANDLLAQSGINTIMYCTETVNETELNSIATPISSMAIGCMNGNVCVAYCSDEDGDATTVNDVKTYFGTVDGSFAAITDGASSSSAVNFMRLGSEGSKLFFLNNSILCYYDGNAIKQYDSVTELGDDYSIINDGSNTTYLLYNANNGDNSQLYLRIYDSSDDTWKQPIALTNTPGYAENFSAAVLGTKVVAMFTRSDVTISADSIESATDLYAVVMTPAHDLCLSDVSFDSDSIALGGTLPITLTVKNNGEIDETGVVVTVSANGVETQSFAIDTSLNSGDTQQINIEYVLPNTATDTEFTFSIASSTGEEIILDDNSIGKALFLANLSIDVHKLMSDSVSTVLVPVSNIGFVDTSATLYIRRDSEDGEILAQFDMGVIRAGTMQVMEFYDGYIKSLMDGSSSLCFSVIANNDEYMIANNSNFISVTEIDLSDSQYKFAVTFVDMDGEVLSTQSIAYGNAAVAPEAPTKEGYIFIGWDKEFGYITDTLTVTARYAIARTVTFVDWDGTVLSTQVVADGNAATAPEVPEREGYTFTGWSVDFSIITSDCVIYAVYAPIVVSGDVNGDGLVTSIDAIILMRYALGIYVYALTPAQIAAADVNGDGILSSIDAILIMRRTLGLIEIVSGNGVAAVNQHTPFNACTLVSFKRNAPLM